MLHHMVHTIYVAQPNSLLDTIVKMVGIIAGFVTGLSAWLAYKEYKRKNQREQTQAVIDQISFFNEKVITTHDQFVSKLREKEGKNYICKRVQLDEPGFKKMKDKFFEESKEQMEVIKRNPEAGTLQIKLLNYLEEFAMRVLLNQTENHKFMSSLKFAYIELVESCGSVLLMHTALTSNTPLFNYTLKLYLKWKDQVDRTPINQKLTKFIDEVKGPKPQ